MLPRQRGAAPEPLYPDSLMPYATEGRPDPPPQTETPRGPVGLACFLLAVFVFAGIASGADDWAAWVDAQQTHLREEHPPED